MNYPEGKFEPADEPAPPPTYSAKLGSYRKLGRMIPVPATIFLGRPR